MPESLLRKFSCKGGLRDRNLARVIYCLVPASASDSDILGELETSQKFVEKGLKMQMDLQTEMVHKS